MELNADQFGVFVLGLALLVSLLAALLVSSWRR